MRFSWHRLDDGLRSDCSVTLIGEANTPAGPTVNLWSNVESARVCHARADAWDNAPAESFFGSLKEKCVGNILYQSHEEARQALFISVEIYYNRLRRH